MTALMYEIIYVWVAAVGLISFFFPKAGIEEVSIPAVFITLLLASIIPVLKKSGWTIRLIIAGVLIALSVASVFLLRNDVIREFLYGYKNFLYLPLIALGAVVIGEALVYIRPLKIIVTAALIAYMIRAAVESQPVDKPMILCVSSMIMITIIEEMQRRWIKAGDTDNKKHLVNVFIFVMITLCLIIVSPAPDEPYDWQFVKNIINAAQEMFYEWQRNLTPDGVYDPTVNSIGFSGRGEVVGNLAHSEDDVLVLHEVSSSLRYVRLSGKTFDTFDGRAWYSNDPSANDDAILDTIAFLASVSEYTDVPVDLTKRTMLTVEYSALRSDYVFVPLKPLIGPSGTDGKEIEFASGDMHWNSKEIPADYYLNYYRMNSANPVFNEFLKQAEIPTKEAYDYQIADKSMSGEAGLSYEDYLAYTRWVKEYYTEAPVLSDDLRAYMDEVYEGCEDDIDKLDRLCALLKSFEYTDSPGDLPEYVTDASSMLDYFMLESRRGYCTHFATAFVLLARAEGIPARFVQGYNVPTEGKADVTVYTWMAHAWPEVYIDGAGWITYEPTPGYGGGSYWLTEAQSKDTYGNLGAGYGGYQGQEEPESVEEPEEIEAEAGPKTHIPWYVIVIPIVSGLGFVALFIVVGNLLVSFSFARKGEEERYKILCRQVLGLLDILGLLVMPGETLREYGERIAKDAGDELSAFIGNQTLYLYAEGKAVKTYEKQAFDYRNALLKRIRHEQPFRYVIYYLSFQKVKYGKSVDKD